MPVAIWRSPYALSSTLAGSQLLSADAFIKLPGGGFLAVTRDTNGGDHADLRRFAADGTPLGTEVSFASGSGAPNEPPSLGQMADGRIVATWKTNFGAVSVRFLDAEGTPMGSAFSVPSMAAGTFDKAQIVGLAGGGFALAGESTSNDPGDPGGGIRYQVFGANGAAIGTPALANTTLTSNQGNATVVALANGGFVVAWNSADTGDGMEGCVRLRRFDATGTPAGADAILNTTSANAAFDPELATLADGRIIAVWGNSGTPFRGRFLSSAGVPEGTDFQLDMEASGAPTVLSAVTALQDGGFLMTVVDSVGSVRTRVFNVNGVPSGTTLVVATSGGDAIIEVTATELADGRVAIGWTSQSPSFDLESRVAIVDPRPFEFTLVHANTVSYGSESTNLVNGTTGADTVFLMGGNDTVHGNDGDDLLYGGAGADTLNGDGGNDFLVGGLGGDALNGGSGFNTASWQNETQGAMINLTNQSFNGFAAAGDTLSSINAYYLTEFGDSFINGAAGGYIYGFGGGDILTGGSGSEFIDGGLGGDTINGGPGFDYASYANAASAVTVNLITPASNMGEAAGDAISNIEAFYLSAHADTFVGQTGQNVVFGGGGADTLFGGVNANDWLFGEGGNDFLSGGVFNDLLSGGAGADTYAFASWVGNGIDSILDFTTGSDKFQLSGSGFGLLPGAAIVNGVNFFAAASPFAASAQGTLLYATGVGILYYDPDGSGAGAAIALAQLLGAPSLSAGDFAVV